MSKTLTDNLSKVIAEQDTIQLFQDNPKALDIKEHKTHQNRLAQRTYQRLRGLEQAVGQSSDTIRSSSITDSAISVSGAPSCDDQNWTLDPVLNDIFPSPTLSDSGRTALHRAVCIGNESVTRLLLERGSNIMRQDSFGQTALHLAVEKRCGGLVKVLLENYADPNVTDSLGRTALFQAVQSENEMVAKLLLDASIDLNWKDSLGNVALHLEVERGSEALTLLLLKHGADIDA